MGISNEQLIEKVYLKATVGLKPEWFKSETGTEWYNHIVNLPEPERVTYLVAVLHNQVFNGGFDQYFVNLYGQFAPETVDALLKMGATVAAELLRQAYHLVNDENLPAAEYRANLMAYGFPKLFKDDKLAAALELLDDRYYKQVADEFPGLLAAYLRSEFPED